LERKIVAAVAAVAAKDDIQLGYWKYLILTCLVISRLKDKN